MKRTIKTTNYDVRYFNKNDETVYVESIQIVGSKSESAIKKLFLKNFIETEQNDNIVILSVNAESSQEKTYEMSAETFIEHATIIED